MKPANAALVSVCVMVLCLGGCGPTLDTVEFFNPEGPPSPSEIYSGYFDLELNQSTASEALVSIYLPDYEILSQSKNVIVTMGTKKKKDYKAWFKMVAFSELSQTVQRKYLFIVDERPKFLFTSPWEGAIFDCKMVMDPEVLNKPYSTINLKRIEVLQQVLENFRRDTADVKRDNKELATRAMLVNQALESVLIKLRESPAMSGQLNSEEGLTFPHLSMDKGIAKMFISDDGIVSVEMKFGSTAKKKIDLEDEINALSIDD